MITYGSYTVDAVSCSLLELHDARLECTRRCGHRGVRGRRDMGRTGARDARHLQQRIDRAHLRVLDADGTLRLSVGAEPPQSGPAAVACSYANHPCHMAQHCARWACTRVSLRSTRISLAAQCTTLAVARASDSVGVMVRWHATAEVVCRSKLVRESHQPRGPRAADVQKCARFPIHMIASRPARYPASLGLSKHVPRQADLL